MQSPVNNRWPSTSEVLRRYVENNFASVSFNRSINRARSLAGVTARSEFRLENITYPLDIAVGIGLRT